MNRAERVQFCKKCTNRELDFKKGLICKLTGEQADFEDECENFNLDETVKETTHLDSTNPDDAGALLQVNTEDLEELKKYQNFTYGILGGLGLMCLSAFLWAAITVATGYQIGYMAVGVGLLIGFSMRFFGAGLEPKFGFLGAAYALLACLLGNLFSQLGFAAEAEGINVLDILPYISFSLMIDIMVETFSVMDVLFYGIAIFEGYKFAFRGITEDMLRQRKFIPEANNLRLPLAIASAAIALVVIALFFI